MPNQMNHDEQKDDKPPIIVRAISQYPLPSKAHATDVGYDLTARRIISTKGNLIMCGTGLSVQLPTGFYFEIVPRSSLVKSGYMLANSIGIIDPDYTGELIIPLMKVNPEVAIDIKDHLPFRCAQLIIRKQFMAEFELVAEFSETARGAGGFGSSG